MALNYEYRHFSLWIGTFLVYVSIGALKFALKDSEHQCYSIEGKGSSQTIWKRKIYSCGDSTETSRLWGLSLV